MSVLTALTIVLFCLICAVLACNNANYKRLRAVCGLLAGVDAFVVYWLLRGTPVDHLARAFGGYDLLATLYPLVVFVGGVISLFVSVGWWWIFGRGRTERDIELLD